MDKEMTTLNTGDIIVTNNIDGVPKGSLGVIVSATGLIASVVTVYIFMYNKKEKDYNDNLKYINRFKKTFETLASKNSVNVFDNADEASFIDVEEFFEVNDVGMNSIFIGIDDRLITRLDDTPHTRVAIPIGLEIENEMNEIFEVVKCTEDHISLLSKPDINNIYEDHIDTVLSDFSLDPVISNFKKTIAIVKHDNVMGNLKALGTSKSVKKREVKTETKVLSSSILRAITRK